MTEAEPRSFSALAEATMHLEGYYVTKKPQLHTLSGLENLCNIHEVTQSLVRDLLAGI